MMTHDTDRPANRLVHEKSPYLQQHAHNPVDWYPWGDEAFERARREDKPIFLSIGYSTCHWCHVMERESFENEETARMMNELFVNIKVDREERPDVDSVYMTAVQATTGSGGWPLSAWLTPDLRPFYLGTYFPPRPAYGRPSFQNAMRSLHDAWTGDREKVLRSAAAIMRAVEQSSVIGDDGGEGPGATAIDDAPLDLCFRQLEQSYDPRHGGFGSAPKFPRPSIFEFLLRYHAERNSRPALDMSIDTLRKMAAGGMYDQLGGGFARYSVDAEWRVPHFEKMLYDQGQLLAVLADAYRITKDRQFAQVIEQTVEYLQRDMLDSESGAFYSAEDADSEGEEGTFYVWTEEQLREGLDRDEYAAVEQYYGITHEGNFEHGKNVLHTSATPDEVAARLGNSGEEIEGLLKSAREKLFSIRSKRVRPGRDEKILTSWNGLAISGLARAAAALAEPAYLDLAGAAADGLLERMTVDGKLMHRLKDGEAKIPGYLEDYAFFVQGLIDLYEAGFALRYLKEADRLTRQAIDLFWDQEGGGFFMTAGDDPSVLVRSKSDHDGAEPSGNSVMAMDLLRLGRLFYDQEMLAKGERTIRLFTERVAGYPTMMPLMIAAALALSHPPRQIIIAPSESDSAGTQRLIGQAQQGYRPDTALVVIPPEGADDWMLERMPTLEGMGPVDGKSVAYVCENFTCLQPVTELQ